MSEQPSLRERKKAKTRAQILAVADRMFLKKGFDAVTLEMIAAKCEVSVRTVLRYFETKEDLALAPFYDELEAFRTSLPQRDGDVLSFWRDWVVTHAKRTSERPDWFRKHAAMAREHLPLYARGAAINHMYEDALAAAIAEEWQDRGIAPRLLAAMLVAGNTAVTRQWIATDEPYNADLYVEVVDVAADAFAGKLSGARSR